MRNTLYVLTTRDAMLMIASSVLVILMVALMLGEPNPDMDPVIQDAIMLLAEIALLAPVSLFLMNRNFRMSQLVPLAPFHLFAPTIEELIPPGAQGTRK